MTERSRTRGFTLVETLVAVALVAVITALIGTFVSGLRTTRDAQMITTAQTFARSYFDLTTGLWSNTANFRTNVLPIAADAGGYHPPEGYSYSATVTDVTDPAEPEVTLTYTFEAGASPDTVTDGAGVQVKQLHLDITLPNGKVQEYATLIAAPGV